MRLITRKTGALALALFGFFAKPAHATLTPDVDPLPPVYIEYTLTLEAGDTVSDLLHDAGLDTQSVHDLTARLREKVDLRSIPAGQDFIVSYLETSPDGSTRTLDTIRFFTRDDKNIQVQRKDGRFTVSSAERTLTRVEKAAKGTIVNSLFNAAIEADLPESLVIPFIELFAWDIDFTRDIRTGDSFRVVYEKIYDEHGNLVRYGNILGGELTSRGKTLQSFRMVTSDGNVAYYNAQGLSKRRALLRTPIKFTRISSGFSRSRKHPVLGYTRAHRGTDFAAPTGTPIKAAGDGVIAEIGWKGGYGRYIRVRHNSKFDTAYAHMHRFAKGMRNGVRVRQGQLIGYVGTTGLSSGPHLHYEVHINGDKVDPLKVTLPAAEPLPARDLSAFRAQVARLQELWGASKLATAAPQALPLTP